MKMFSVTLSLAALAISALPASAHHSGAMFDRSKTVSRTGVVKEYIYSNPHTWLNITVDEGGRQVIWGVEGSPPARMRGWGMTPSNIKPGDKVTVRMHPLRDGRPGGSMIDLVLPDGKLLSTQ